MTTMQTTTETLVEMTLKACDDLLNNPLVADNHSEIEQMKRDLIGLPSAGHAQSIIRYLLEIAEGRAA